MNQLVFIDNGKPVTDTLTVAEAFGKEHRRVMQDIRELACSDEFRVHHFVQSDYINGQGRRTPKYLMTEQGFTLLVMGYTGPRAMDFKERYIAAFEVMRQELQPVKGDGLRALIAATHNLLAGQEIMAERLDDVEHRLETQITLDSGQQRRLQRAISERVCSIERDKEARSEWFRQLHRDIKNRWNVSSYKDVLRQNLQEVLNYVAAWVPIRREG